MDDKTLSALTALATKLGTTVEYLWGVLLKQAQISGVVDLLVCVAWVAAVVAWARFVRRKTAVPAITENDYYPRAEWHELVWASVLIVSFITAIAIGCKLSTIAAAFANPEYWALLQILK